MAPKMTGISPKLLAPSRAPVGVVAPKPVFGAAPFGAAVPKGPMGMAGPRAVAPPGAKPQPFLRAATGQMISGGYPH